MSSYAQRDGFLLAISVRKPPSRPVLVAFTQVVLCKLFGTSRAGDEERREEIRSKEEEEEDERRPQKPEKKESEERKRRREEAIQSFLTLIIGRMVACESEILAEQVKRRH